MEKKMRQRMAITVYASSSLTYGVSRRTSSPKSAHIVTTAMNAVHVGLSSHNSRSLRNCGRVSTSSPKMDATALEPRDLGVLPPASSFHSVYAELSWSFGVSRRVMDTFREYTGSSCMARLSASLCAHGSSAGEEALELVPRPDNLGRRDVKLLPLRRLAVSLADIERLGLLELFVLFLEVFDAKLPSDFSTISETKFGMAKASSRGYQAAGNNDMQRGVWEAQQIGARA
mmetsp:Transcript_47012/g.87634  ORF Transcript_47012/g.87634 Transcript_47012/m.87634 type:complete len:230 (-) Transcript_47012:605-1294(-)